MDQTSPHARPAQQRRVLLPLFATLLFAIVLVVGGCTGAITALWNRRKRSPRLISRTTRPPQIQKAQEDAEDTENQEVSEESIREAIADFLVDAPAAEEHNGIPVGFTAGGLAYRGDPRRRDHDRVFRLPVPLLRTPLCADRAGYHRKVRARWKRARFFSDFR